MSSDSKITKCAIYPAIGIARIGNAPEEYYLAPEIPGKPATVTGGYKDSKGRIKKQVARFRIYGLNDEGEVIREITADEAEITWCVHVANRKAAWYNFTNALDLQDMAIPPEPRNKDITGEDRQNLIIEPNSRSITGKDISGEEYQLTGGKFFDLDVPLGELRTDQKGRLLFFGGDGNSASKDKTAPTTFANNDGWHDDTSDGTVRATVSFGDLTIDAEPAMVAVAPPNYGQGLYSVVTMYDVVLDLFYRQKWLNRPEQPNFWQHIYPIFERLKQMQWVNEGFFFLFGHNSPSDFTRPDLLEILADPSEASQDQRNSIFEWFRDPNSEILERAKIPPFYGDAFGEYLEDPQVDLSVTSTQYYWLQQWAEGNFSTEQPDTYQSLEDMPPHSQTKALNQAALEECLGGPFHPGIELTWTMRVASMWKEPFRLNIIKKNEEPQDDFGDYLSPKIALSENGPLSKSGPGTLTRWLGVPWQTDEASCLSGYDRSTYLPLPSFWAARVPNHIFTEDSYKRVIDPQLNIAQRLKHFDYRKDWLRVLNPNYRQRINEMVTKWHELGIVAEYEGDGIENSEEYLPERFWVESDPEPFEGDDPSFEQVKRAEGADPEQVAQAREIVIQKAGIDPQSRPKQERRVFGRGEI